jgi:peptidoglycan hydrolase-like protein with peptidoglycan-binding domain
MKLKYLLAASTALISAAAIAGGDNPAYKTKGAQSQTQSGGAQAQTMDAETVKRVQEALASQGYDPGPADGKLGPKTTEAVKRAQADKGINATGKLDQQTVAALSSGDSSRSSSSSSSSAPAPRSSESSSSGAGGSAMSPERTAEPPQTSSSSSQSNPSVGSTGGDSGSGAAK